MEKDDAAVLGAKTQADGVTADLAVFHIALIYCRQVEQHADGLPAVWAGEAMLDDFVSHIVPEFANAGFRSTVIDLLQNSRQFVTSLFTISLSIVSQTWSGKSPADTP